MRKLMVLFVFVLVLAAALLSVDVRADWPVYRPPATCVPGEPYYAIGSCVLGAPPTATVTPTRDEFMPLPPFTPDPAEYPPPPVLGTPAVTPVVSSWTFGPSVLLPLIVRWPDSYPVRPTVTPVPVETWEPTNTPFPVGPSPSPTWTTTAGTVTPTKTPVPVGG